MTEDSDEHEFHVVDVEIGDVPETDVVAVTLTDARGGRVRLHLNSDMAVLLRERLSAAIDKRAGP
ncbi:hypothetical protein [Aliihoeflea sp. 40Bstr573]|uniref:hypothetical protein n=1 Tax=Aliihoeflea sp. 40Bstr573 TaxID=2696467 RepID=UPI002095853F|nr:hypothetical protein [Aliihoeflea sp. 40Bstr573]MCO6386252.1 hypothetical protein [Aliihoeflea sp. 40Bstr573]